MNYMTIFLLLHILLTILFIILYRKKSLACIASEALLIFLLPVGGVILICVLHLYKNLSDEKTFKHTDLFVNFKDKYTFIYTQDISSETNIIPLEEALIINDYKTKRKELLNTLKKDTGKFVSQLQTAVKDKDTETSHYAASAIMVFKQSLLKSLTEKKTLYELLPSSIENTTNYAEELYKYIESGFATDEQKIMYTKEYTLLVDKLLENDLDILVYEQYMTRMVNKQIELNDFESAKHHIKNFIDRYSTNETAYILLLSLDYHTKDLVKLKNDLELVIKVLPYKSENLLNLITFWKDMINNV